ncbi:hypothetical protein ACFQGT_18115 [Natrialbaceae archaeon GCM10025810]|uniref:hypothetical protein n=1 Tax=Halovalidus salilacus TaxID=3075124 RepID=UPI003616A120
MSLQTLSKMASNEPVGQRGRLLAGIALLAVLGGALVWAGATPDNPLGPAYPTEFEVMPAPEAYVGEQVILHGRVVDTEPVVIATPTSGSDRVTLVGAERYRGTVDGPLEPGVHMTAFGTLAEASTLTVERGLTRTPAEATYMYVVSALGGLWVAGRFGQGWRFDRQQLAFVPRADSRSTADRDGPPSDRQAGRLTDDESDTAGER